MHVGKLIGPLCYTDTEDAKLAYILTFLFASVICTPSCFKATAILNLHISTNPMRTT